MSSARLQYIAKAMGKKLVPAFSGDHSAPIGLLRNIDKVMFDVARDHGAPSVELDQALTVIAEEILQKFTKGDPTNNLQYLQWITGRYIEKDFVYEDLDRVRGELELFETYKPRLRRDNRQVDINKYKSAADVFSLIDSYVQNDQPSSKKQQVRREEDSYFEEKKAILWYRDDTIKIVIPLTQQASCFFGKGTRWCTAATQSYNAFNSYVKDGPLYIIMTPSGKYQFHFESGQYMNSLDRSVRVGDIVKQYPQLKDAFDTVATRLGLIFLMKKVTPEGMLNALKRSHIDSQRYDGVGEYSQEVADILASVDVEAQDEQVALYVVSISVKLAMKYIRPDLQQTMTFQHAIIIKRPELLQSINPKHQTEQLVAAVVQKVPKMLRYVRPDLMTEQLLISAVRKEPEVLGQVPRDKQLLPVITAAFKATDNMNMKRTLINMVHDTALQKQLRQTIKELA